MNNNPIEELRRMETPVTEEEWTSIVNDRRYARKFGRKNGLSPKGRAALIAGAAVVLITVPILVKTLSHSSSETTQTVPATTEKVTVEKIDDNITTAPQPSATTASPTTTAEPRVEIATTASPSPNNTELPATPAVAIVQPDANPTVANVTIRPEKPAATSATQPTISAQQPDNQAITKPKQNTVTPITPEDSHNEIVMRSAEEDPVPETDQFFIPSAFTPNGDGLNDLFLVKANFQPQSFELTILNRGSEALFQTRDMNIGWDGQHHGKLLPQGVYVCIIKYKDSQGNEHIQQGQVLLIP